MGLRCGTFGLSALWCLSFQLQKTTIEVNQTKEDMKSLQSDLACADKEISVRQIKQICLFVMSDVRGCDFCVQPVHRAWRRKWSFFRNLWAHQRGLTKPSVGSSLKGASPAVGLHSPRAFDRMLKNAFALCAHALVAAFPSALPHWSWSSLASTIQQIARTLTSTWPTTSLRQTTGPRDQRRFHWRKCVSIHPCKSHVTQCGNVFFCV